jgi:hypothetical protein
MTTPDIAGLCERLNTLWLELNDAHAEPPATARIMNALHQSANTLERQAAEIERLREALTDALPYVVQFEDMRDGIHGAPEPNDAMQLVHEIRAALTGEDTAGLPTSQNTEPGLAFSDAGEP